MHDFSRFIREIPDYPKPGILFKDITPLLGNPTAFHKAIDEFEHRYKCESIDVVAGTEARGFIFAAALAYRTRCRFCSLSGKKVSCLIIHTKPHTILNTVVIRLQFIKMRSPNTAKSLCVMISWQLEERLLRQLISLRNWKGTSLVLLF